MTFLLFLASVAVLEYLLRDTRQKSNVAPQALEVKNVAGYDPPVSAESSTSDLLSLGRALGSANPVKAVDSEKVTKEETVH